MADAAVEPVDLEKDLIVGMIILAVRIMIGQTEIVLAAVEVMGKISSSLHILVVSLIYNVFLPEYSLSSILFPSIS